MKKPDSASNVSRRGLLKVASLAGVTAVSPSAGEVKAQVPAQRRTAGPTTPPPNPGAERGDHPEIAVVQGPSGSDYMADVIKSLGIEHVASNPGNLFRGLHESLVNY
jgi:acetolactate synthase-1/2/3 large subunit